MLRVHTWISLRKAQLSTAYDNIVAVVVLWRVAWRGRYVAKARWGNGYSTKPNRARGEEREEDLPKESEVLRDN